jgi:hypothetical protein
MFLDEGRCCPSGPRKKRSSALQGFIQPATLAAAPDLFMLYLLHDFQLLILLGIISINVLIAPLSQQLWSQSIMANASSRYGLLLWPHIIPEVLGPRPDP